MTVPSPTQHIELDKPRKKSRLVRKSTYIGFHVFVKCYRVLFVLGSAKGCSPRGQETGGRAEEREDVAASWSARGGATKQKRIRDKYTNHI